MTKSNIFALAVGTLILTLGAAYWLRSSPQELILRFHPYVGDKPLILNNQTYKNPGGSGHFSIRDFQLFISNIVLDSSSSRIKEPESYHLVRFDGNTSFDQIVIPKIDIQHLKQLSFGIGIDKSANGTIVISGDLDPNSRMAWNWQVGYKFLLLEGMLTINNEQLPLVYHIGFDESYTELNFNITDDIFSNRNVVNFKIDLLRLFKKGYASSNVSVSQHSNEGIKYIDLSEMPHVKFAPDDVEAIAKGFHDFISIL
jgi:hypothetical protein